MVTVLLSACQSEQMKTADSVTSVETLKSRETKNFEDALRAIGKGGARYVEENGQLNQVGIIVV